MPPTPSTSAWTWVPQHNLYFNQTTQQWAKPKPDGSWEYAAAAGQTETDSVKQNGVGVSKGKLREVDTGTVGEDAIEEGEEEGELPPDDGDADGANTDDIDGEPLSIPYEQQQWPSSDVDDEPPPSTPPPLLRLVVHSSTLLPIGHIALTDPEDTLLIGRDRSFNKIIRLKEMEVSKSHATVYYDSGGEGERGLREEEGGWMIVDNGSTHGTFLSLPDEKGKGKRLSEAKKASQPYSLSHNSYESPPSPFATTSSLKLLHPHRQLSIGNTTFLIHLHFKFPCSTCSISEDGSNLLPLTDVVEEKEKEKPSVGYGDGKGLKALTKAEKEIQRRAKMNGLREAYSLNNSKVTSKGVNADNDVGSGSGTKKFVDRAAIRRSLGTSTPPTSSSNNSSTLSNRSTPPQPEPSINPFSANSKGAQLLSKLTSNEKSNSGGGSGLEL